MQISARAEYAIQAMTCLAASDGDPVTRNAISDAQRIPQKFLELILGQLRRAGLVTSTRGMTGGYSLRTPADRISLADIVRAVDGPLALIRGLPPEETEYPEPTQGLRTVWVALRSSVRTVLESITLEQLATDRLPESVIALSENPGAWLVSSASPGLRRGEAGQSPARAHSLGEA